MYRDVNEEGELTYDPDKLYAEGTADADGEGEGDWEDVPPASPTFRDNSDQCPRTEPGKALVRKSVAEDCRQLFDHREEQRRPSKRESKDTEDGVWRKRARKAGDGLKGKERNGRGEDSKYRDLARTASKLLNLARSARNCGGTRSDRAGVSERLSRVGEEKSPREHPCAAQDFEADTEETPDDHNLIDNRGVERYCDDEGRYAAASPTHAPESRLRFEKSSLYEDFRQHDDGRPPLCRMPVHKPVPEPHVELCGQWGIAILAAHTPLKLDLAGSSSVSDPSEDDAFLRLTLSPPGQHSFNEERPTPPASAHSQQVASSAESEAERNWPRRRQTSVDRLSAKLKEELIRPPYPWATDRRAVVHSLKWITRLGINRIHGEVLCKRCDGSQTMDIDLQASFLQLDNYFMSNKYSMHDRAPKIWTLPRLLDCTMCHQSDCLKPVINPRKRHINWLFLMLTGTLGTCTLEQLKYFCKHTQKHRTGAKDRVLYLTYLGLLKQLNPTGNYD